MYGKRRLKDTFTNAVAMFHYFGSPQIFLTIYGKLKLG